ncbi:hypothetical protein TNCV_1358781 [Trichonephila clavipes]|uniref:Endonuclease/exonuclease/phosphatase domain-containing protein n=1 Tax=Trichonephila clavipes TaxID=2585209 RepID=A0A8X6S7W5_TRICX|nr:hypothetical protein TNCV_1358781 [Trichonephila clavipes]
MSVLTGPKPILKVNVDPRPKHNTAFVGLTRVNNQGEHSLSNPVFIFDDFNLHHPTWGSSHISKRSNEFVEWLTNSNFILNTITPTDRSNVDSGALLDLTLYSLSLFGYSNTYA